MSLPITAVGPLKVLIKPILTVFCCAGAGAIANSVTMPAATTNFLNIAPSLVHGLARYYRIDLKLKSPVPLRHLRAIGISRTGAYKFATSQRNRRSQQDNRHA